MPNSLPFPVRVAAGLVSTGLDTIRGLPQNLPTIGVEIAGHVTKAGLQLRQQFVELALRGDELLQSEAEPEEHPAWAHFDDEEPDLATQARPADRPPNATAGDDAGTTAAGDAGSATGDPGSAAGDSGTAAGESGTSADGDALLPGYDSMTLAQVRGHLRHLDVDEVRRLLEHEKAGGNRPAMVTLLGNRIVTLQQR